MEPQTPATWISQHQQDMTEDLIALCNINSGSENVAGLNEAADWLECAFAVLKTPVRRITLPEYRLVDDQGIESTFKTGPALRWDLGPDRATQSKQLPSCLWTIHYDTVYEPSDSFQRCLTMTDNKLCGPGVIDAKGGIIVMLYAARLAQQFLDLSKIQLSLVLTPDEEIGSPSSISFWKEIAPQFSTGFLFEPTMADGSLVQSRKGTGTFIFVVRGKAAHAGRNFQDGRNAVVQACRIAQELDSYNGKRPNVTINIGRLRGGNAVNVVPDVAVLRVNVRISSPEDQSWLESICQQTVDKFNNPEHGFRIELHGGIHAPPKTLDPPTKHLQHCVEQAGQTLGLSIRWRDSGGASDGNKLQALGIPNIDTFGPRGDGLHSHNEWIELNSLPEKALLTFETLRALYYQ